MKKVISALSLAASLLVSPVVFAEIVNINQADAEEIRANLSGIGLKKAEAIVAYRKEFGAFKTLEEIKEVKGIGDGIFEKIKGDLSLGEVTSRGVSAETNDQPVKAMKETKTEKAEKAEKAKEKKDKKSTKASTDDKTQSTATPEADPAKQTQAAKAEDLKQTPKKVSTQTAPKPSEKDKKTSRTDQAAGKVNKS